MFAPAHAVFCTPHNAYSILNTPRSELSIAVTVTIHITTITAKMESIRGHQHAVDRARDRPRRPQAAGRPQHDPDPPPTQPRAAGSRPGVAHGTKRPLHARAMGCRFWQAAERAANGGRRAAARPETAAVASAVAPTMRVVEPRPLVDRAASMAAPESVATAGISSSEGRDRAGKARVRALGGGTHLLGRSKEALPPPSRQWQGGRPPPDANTTISAASTVWKQPRRSGRSGSGPSACPLLRLGGDMAGGAGAHLCALKEQVEGVLPARSDAASSTNWAAGLPRRAR